MHEQYLLWGPKYRNKDLCWAVWSLRGIVKLKAVPEAQSGRCLKLKLRHVTVLIPLFAVPKGPKNANMEHVVSVSGTVEIKLNFLKSVIHRRN